MKIVDEAPVIHRAEPMPARTGSPAGTWLAQLERAWLDRWNVAGEGAPSASQRPAADSDAWDATHPGATAPRDTLARPKAASAPCGVLSSAAAARADLTNVNGSVGRPWGGMLPPPSGAGGPNALATTPSQEPRALTLTPSPSSMPSRTADDVEPPSASNAGRRPHHAMEPPPSRTLLQVWVAHATAQVSLRDASLSQGEAARTGRAVANELLGLGVYAVRIYVNGVEGRYGSLARAAQPPLHRFAAGADVHSHSHRLK
jgi:hypothetical protein